MTEKYEARECKISALMVPDNWNLASSPVHEEYRCETHDMGLAAFSAGTATSGPMCLIGKIEHATAEALARIEQAFIAEKA